MRLPRARRPAFFAAAGAVLLAGSIGGAGTFALWTDQAQVDSVTISAGELKLTIDGEDGNPTAVQWTGLQMANMAPGESAAAFMMMENSGTVPFELDVDAYASGALRQHIKVKVVWGGSVQVVSANYKRRYVCQGGTQTWGKAALPAVGTPVRVVNSSTFDSSIDPDFDLALCVQISMDENAPNASQRENYAPTLTFTATQE